MEISTYWDDMAQEFRAVVVDYEDATPIGSGSSKEDALFDLVQLLKPTDAARISAINAYCDEIAWKDRARIYNRLVELGKPHDEANAEAALAMRRFQSGFEYAVELLA